MSLFVDTCVWSIALRRDVPDRGAEVTELVQSLQRGDPIITTGLVLQELLQGFAGPKARTAILERFRLCLCWFPTGMTMLRRPICATSTGAAGCSLERSTR